MPPKATLAIILAAVAMPFASGCIYAGGRTVRDVGPQISEQSIAVIEPGKTPADWVTATFGEPSHRGTTADGAEIRAVVGAGVSVLPRRHRGIRHPDWGPVPLGRQQDPQPPPQDRELQILVCALNVRLASEAEGWP